MVPGGGSSRMTLLTLILQPAPTTNSLVGFLPLILIVGIFYFLVFMPMQRQKKQQQAMLKGLENGNVILTTGGIVGTIVTINNDDTLILRVKPDNIKLQVARSAVSGLVPDEKK
jgi:preprotein translocase subunit YajC